MKWFLITIMFPTLIVSQEIIDFNSYSDKELSTAQYNYYDSGDYNTAILILLYRIENSKDKENVDYITNVNNLGIYYLKNGDYQQAKEVIENSLSIQKQLFGTNHHDYLSTQSDLASIHARLGDYNTALELNNQSLKLCDILGFDDLNCKKIKQNIASNYSHLGNLPKALEIYEDLANSYSNKEDKLSEQYIYLLNNLASTYFKLNDYQKSLSYRLEALDLASEEVGQNNQLYGRILSSLANDYMALDKDSLAIFSAKKAVEILRLSLGEEHPVTLHTKTVLANIYEIGYNDKYKSLEINQKILIAQEKKIGKDHPLYANTLFNLAENYFSLAKYTAWEILVWDGLEIIEQKFGKEHPIYVHQFGRFIENLFKKINKQDKTDTYMISGGDTLNFGKELDYGMILNWATKCQDLRTNIFKKYESGLDNNLREGLYQDLLNKNKLPFRLSYEIQDDKSIKEQYNLLCFLKGRELSKSSSITKTVFESGDQELIDEYKKWQSLMKKLNTIYENNSITNFSTASSHLELQNEIQYLERSLTRKSYDFSKNLKVYTFDDIVSKLDKDEVYIDILKIDFIPHTPEIVYYAYIIKKGYEYPKLIEISSTAGDNSNQKIWTENYFNGNILDTKAYSYYRYEIKSQFPENRLAYSLYWKKFESYLTNISKIYFSPDGIYNKINLNVLYDKKEKKFLIDKFDIISVNNVEDFISIKETKGFTNNENLKECVLFGNPTFLLDNNDYQDILTNNSSIQRETNTYYLDTIKRGMLISQLPGTKLEIENISKILSSNDWNVTIFSEKDASEENIKKVVSPRILHIATHGYFLPDQKQIKYLPNKILNIEKNKVNPLFKSGLLFTGASNLLNSEKKLNDNGWFNAFEFSLLNLRRTELVVLSACETGLGEVKNVKGIYGMQRAVKIAGAKSVIMSMWKVDDKATQKLMTYFYGNWLDKNMTKKEAFKAAQIKLRSEYPEPFFWGAFVMIGN